MSSDDQAAIERRNELKKMQEEALALQNDAPSEQPDDQSEGEEITGFLTSLKSDKEKRKHQLGLVKDLYENPMKLNFKQQFVPCSSTPEEIEERKTELQFRIEMLKAVLEMTEGELQLLSRAATPDGQPRSGDQQDGDQQDADQQDADQKVDDQKVDEEPSQENEARLSTD